MQKVGPRSGLDLNGADPYAHLAETLTAIAADHTQIQMNGLLP